MSTEYDNIARIGGTYLDYNNEVERLLSVYTHRQCTKCVRKILQLLPPANYETVVDLGCSTGAWYEDYKAMGFSRIIGVDISKERLAMAAKRGYSATYHCNAYELPFDDHTQNCIISNDMLVHVLQDTHQLRIFEEIKRVLSEKGIFIFNVANASGYGFNVDTALAYCRFNTPLTILNLIKTSSLTLKHIIPAYYMIPRVGAHPKFVHISARFLFIMTDSILTSFNNISKAKVVYYAVSASR